MRKRTQAREYALQFLYQYEMNPPDSLDSAIGDFWTQNPPSSQESRLYAEVLIRGALENLSRLDEVISKVAQNWQLGRMAVIDRNILRFAAYELLFMEEIPPKVAINEAVNLAKKFSQEDSGKFVNGILDKITHTEKRFRPDAPSEP
jgi:N utilization substance protein B